MLSKGNDGRKQGEIVCIDDLVPKDHLLRKIEAAVDFTKIYEIVEDLYCKNNGRPSTDPVVLFKIAIIQHLYGVSSLRRTAEDINLRRRIKILRLFVAIICDISSLRLCLLPCIPVQKPLPSRACAETSSATSTASCRIRA